MNNENPIPENPGEIPAVLHTPFFSPHHQKGISLRSPPKDESCYYDGIVPGVIYMVGQGPPTRYTGFSCYNRKGICSVNCVLYEQGCLFKQSLREDTHRLIDDKILFSSSSSHPKDEQQVSVEVPGHPSSALQASDGTFIVTEAFLKERKHEAVLEEMEQKLGGNKNESKQEV